ncbi:hypothetical protein N7492_003132 [Penicillium capsulatum]|uniref:Uncharacterized protein n=1 Tax=Penicillium capsulatum TaxID=69766 RepID=A0A9W9ILE5_9EURO|nr:hypothetical protein N7492_003132 [Penicillium capsulatum]KAJ6122278.1 hypothetical protein N7512_004743 [Penicillium capsulatum]
MDERVDRSESDRSNNNNDSGNNNDDQNQSSSDNKQTTQDEKSTSSKDPITITLTSTGTISGTPALTSTISLAPPIPLTTTFTPPSACLNDLWQTESDSSKWLHLGPLNTTECLPSGWSPYSYFSPGVCPSGWVMATTSTTSAKGHGGVETVGTCCPRYLYGFDCIPGPSDWDFNTRPSSKHTFPWYQTELCQWSPNSKLIYNFHSSVNAGTQEIEATMTPGGVWNAYGIVVRWKPSDHVSAATATATTLSTQTSSDSSSGDPAASSLGLSSGAKAGIGIGVAVGGLAVIFAVAFFILRRRKLRETAVSQEIENPPLEKVPLDPSLAELPQNAIFEMADSSAEPVTQSPVEMDAAGAK